MVTQRQRRGKPRGPRWKFIMGGKATSGVPTFIRRCQAIRDARDISADEKVVLFTLLTYAHSFSLWCYPKVPTIARGAGLSVRHVCDVLRALSGGDGCPQWRHVWLYRVYPRGGHRSVRYRMLFPDMPNGSRVTHPGEPVLAPMPTAEQWLNAEPELDDDEAA